MGRAYAHARSALYVDYLLIRGTARWLWSVASNRRELRR